MPNDEDKVDSKLNTENLSQSDGSYSPHFSENVEASSEFSNKGNENSALNSSQYNSAEKDERATTFEETQNESEGNVGLYPNINAHDDINLRRHDISYVVHCLNQFMHSPLKSHLKIAFKILKYLNGSPISSKASAIVTMVNLSSSSNTTSDLNNQSLLIQNPLFLHPSDSPGQLGVESTALYSKGETKDKCTIFGFKWHPPAKCWEKVGYPTWHHKYKQNQKAKSGIKNGNANAPSEYIDRWRRSKQFEQLLKSLPHFNQNGENTPEIQHPFGEGESDHMSPDNNDLDNVHVLKNKQVINLPNGHTSVISKDFKTRKVLGLGKKKAGLYHLLNLPLDKIHAQLSSMVVSALEDCSMYSFFSNCSVVTPPNWVAAE
ncbi:hypothetical protein Tco_0431215 [Tanacetum coccineum]